MNSHYARRHRPRPVPVPRSPVSLNYSSRPTHRRTLPASRSPAPLAARATRHQAYASDSAIAVAAIPSSCAEICLKTRAHAAPRAANFKFRKLRMHPSRQPLASYPAVQRSLKRVKQMRCVRESRTVARRTSPRRRVRAMCAGCGFENHTRSVLYFCEPRAPARGLADGIRRR